VTTTSTTWELEGDRLRKAHHYFVYDTSKIDVGAMRDEAQRRAFDNRTPEDSVIHHHPYDENGASCHNTDHEHYSAGQGKVS
jgi:hypothetical protein